MSVMRAVREVRPQVAGLSDAERGQLEHRLFGDVPPAEETVAARADQRAVPPPRGWIRRSATAAAALLVVAGVAALAVVDRGQNPAATTIPATGPMTSEAPPPSIEPRDSSVPSAAPDMATSHGPAFTELLVVPPPDGFELVSATYQRNDPDGDVGIAVYREVDSDVALELTVRSTPDFFDHLIDAGRQTWVVDDRVVVNDGQLPECVLDHCSVGLQWDERTAISLAWGFHGAALGSEHTVERLVELVSDLVESPGSWVAGSLAPGSDTVHHDLLVAAMRAALDRLPTVAAWVIGVAPNTTTIEIDRGAAHGLAVGMPVVDNTGVVGKITQVNSESSIVMLVVDGNYAVQARAEYGGSASFDAVAVGDGAGQLQLTTLGDPDPYTTPGALVVTQGGSDSLAPPGLPIGTLTTGVDGDAEPRVHPSANLDDLEDVHVVLYRPRSVPG